MKILPSDLLLRVLFGGLVWAGLSATRAAEPEGFPDPLPPDISFSSVVSSQDYPKLKYPVPIIGWKNHPEEIHVTPAGVLVLPEPRWPESLSLTPALRLQNQPQAQMLDADTVAQHLVDGYKPGVESEWRTGGLRVQQLAFGSLLEGTEVRTGREDLLGFCRYTLKNETGTNLSGQFYLCFGEGARHQSIKQFQIAYPFKLTYAAPFLMESGGGVAACVLSSSLGKETFQPAQPLPNLGGGHIFNPDEKTSAGPDYEIPLERSGDRIALGGWTSPSGVDLYFQASTKHSSAVRVQLRVATDSGIREAAWFRSPASAPQGAGDALAPGAVSARVSWADLSRVLPQGPSRLILRALLPGDREESSVTAWEPVVYAVPPGIVPAFKSRRAVPDQNSLQIAFHLRPGQEGSVEVVLPYFPVSREKGRQIACLRLKDRLADFRRFWEAELNGKAQFIVPEKRIRDSYRACMAYNLILVDRDPATGLLLPHPDATEYEHVWGGDSGVIIQSMDRLGYHQEAEDCTKIFLSRQGTRKPDGEVSSAEGFFPGDAPEKWISENGFILWALAEHYKLTGDVDWLRAVAPNMVASAGWIMRERQATKHLVNGEKPRHFGLLPRGRSSDLADWDYWYFNDSYSYLGLRDAAEVLPDAGFQEDARRIKADAADYRQCILDSVERSINHQSDPPFVPLTPYKNEMPTRDYLYRYWYSICSPIYMVEAGVFGPQDEKTLWINQTIQKLVMVSGLPRFSPDEIDPHYVYNQALTELERGETDKFIWTLYSLFAYGQSRDTYATIEVVNFRTGGLGEDWDACRQPHMHSNSRVLAMLRIALALEQGDTLHLMMGTPRGWLDDGQRIEVKNAPTYFGNVSYTARSNMKSREVVIEIRPPTRKPSDIVLHVRPPTRFGVIQSVSVNGTPWSDFTGEAVNLGKRTGATTVRCAFK